MIDINNLEICFNKDSLKVEDISVKSMHKNEKTDLYIYFFSFYMLQFKERIEITIDFLQTYNKD